jgi:hypothetical protein
MADEKLALKTFLLQLLSDILHWKQDGLLLKWKTALDHLWSHENDRCCNTYAGNPVFFLLLYSDFHIIIIDSDLPFKKTGTNGTETLRPNRPTV